jgi:hypothetical protein
MDLSRLYGIQYVRLGPGAATARARQTGLAVDDGDELVVSMDVWPEAVRPAPLRARDGRLIAGDPVLLDATAGGLVFEGAIERREVMVDWDQVRELQVVGRPRRRSA